jgi:hypothetical protein
MPYGEKPITVYKFTQFIGFALFTMFTRFAVLRLNEPGKLGKLGRLSKLVFLLCLLGAVLFAGVGEARMKGRCKDCHSMHASTPFPVLTKGGCVGCHGRIPDGTENIITIGKVRIPQILHHMEDGDLASGNFYYVADGYNPDYSKGHNVLGISHQESVPTMNTPPGFIGDVVIPGGKGPVYWPPEQQLTCSGTWGCHGNRTIEDPYLSLYKAHHTHNGEIDGSTNGKSYRFLYGITGVEHPNWEYLATTDDHNGYKGDFNHNTMDTISYLCGECHGKFHPSSNLGGAKDVGSNFTIWLRHPADISFSNVHGGFGSSEFLGYTTYSLESPVAYFNPTGKEKVVDSNSIVMCLSCHRAHASNFSDALRWDYGNIIAGISTTGGCLVCHTNKGKQE